MPQHWLWRLKLPSLQQQQQKGANWLNTATSPGRRANTCTSSFSKHRELLAWAYRNSCVLWQPERTKQLSMPHRRAALGLLPPGTNSGPSALRVLSGGVLQLCSRKTRLRSGKGAVTMVLHTTGREGTLRIPLPEVVSSLGRRPHTTRRPRASRSIGPSTSRTTRALRSRRLPHTL